MTARIMKISGPVGVINYTLDLSTAKPLCFVLDAESKRTVIDSEGFVLDADLNATTERLFTPKELMEFAQTRWFVNSKNLSHSPLQAVHDWINSVLTVDFPLDAGLRYNEPPQDYPLDWAVSGTGNKRTLTNSDGLVVTLEANQSAEFILALVDILREAIERGGLKDKKGSTTAN